MSIASGFRFVGIAPGVDLKERKSKVLNSQTEPFTLDEIRGYKVFTGLVTQSGGSVYQDTRSGVLTIGVTYKITDDTSNPDFTNVGAPNNFLDTSFIATGTTPNSWGQATLESNTGAPVVTVLENTIGNVWFSYQDVGFYSVKSESLFTDAKTWVNPVIVLGIGGPASRGVMYLNIETTISIITELDVDSVSDGILFNTPIEIRVYS